MHTIKFWLVVVFNVALGSCIQTNDLGICFYKAILS